MRVIRFDGFEFDTKNHELRRHGVLIALPAQASRILTLLFSRPNALVTREEIINELWPGERFGEFDSRLNFEVSRIREALADDAERPRYVETVRKRGYKFIAELNDTAGGERNFSLEQAAPQPKQSSFPSLESSANVSSTRESVVFETFMTKLRRFLAGALVGAVAVLLIWAAKVHVSTVEGDPKDPPPAPAITGVSRIFPRQTQKITIEGHGFGYYYTPLNGLDTPFLAIGDETGHWSAGRTIPDNADDVTLRVSTWTDTQIVIEGFAGDYGRNYWTLEAGDTIKLRVWNPQSGAGPVEYFLKVSPQPDTGKVTGTHEGKPD